MAYKLTFVQPTMTSAPPEEILVGGSKSMDIIETMLRSHVTVQSRRFSMNSEVPLAIREAAIKQERAIKSVEITFSENGTALINNEVPDMDYYRVEEV